MIMHNLPPLPKLRIIITFTRLRTSVTHLILPGGKEAWITDIFGTLGFLIMMVNDTFSALGSINLGFQYQNKLVPKLLSVEPQLLAVKTNLQTKTTSVRHVNTFTSSAPMRERKENRHRSEMPKRKCKMKRSTSESKLPRVKEWRHWIQPEV
ncbi:hypothetical protein M758_7G187900 [Ceratodon purpureus]|uniref:Uncharacterized protein n=1 Tax=Ceratodon purpureus TaxID=3225 RepID=A0A8T0HDD5_CERPU|nr:hypothetical protein KC19_7G191200 [Ceratodon purpureus]KAG0612067.1 hypothetical protein M758_7G187900 [Ceratodon purpureus]